MDRSARSPVRLIRMYAALCRFNKSSSLSKAPCVSLSFYLFFFSSTKGEGAFCNSSK